jgi:hypothetical protein
MPNPAGGSGRDEQEPQVVDQGRRDRGQFLGWPSGGKQVDEQKDHAAERPRKRDVEARHHDLADELKALIERRFKRDRSDNDLSHRHSGRGRWNAVDRPETV